MVFADDAPLNHCVVRIPERAQELLVLGMLTYWKIEWTSDPVEGEKQVRPLVDAVMMVYDLKPGTPAWPTLQSIRSLRDGHWWKLYSQKKISLN